MVRRGDQESLLKYFDHNCRPLYRSGVRFDAEGNIFYPTWRQVKRQEVGPQDYSLLSRTRMNEDLYLGLSLVTKKPYELRINRIAKDGGGVKVAIRSVEHVLESEIEKEMPQMQMVRGRIGELFDLFGDFSSVTEEQFNDSMRTTCDRLARVGFNPETVLLEEKDQMGQWLIKGSGGKDSLARRNNLITMMVLQAAYRRAVVREQGIGQIMSKFVRMREALRFEQEFCREIFTEVMDRLAPQAMQAHYLFRYPDKPAQNVWIVTGMLKTACWLLTQPHVKPYRPAAREAEEVLREAVELFSENRRQEIVERELFEQARRILEDTLRSEEGSLSEGRVDPQIPYGTVPHLPQIRG